MSVLALSPASRPRWFAGALTAAIFFAMALWGLASGHPHEDAYILFAYVDHVAAGKGIVFSAGAERAEGATDFLWMMMLAVLRVAGIPAGVGAALLNAAGLGVVAAVCVRALRWTCDRAAQVRGGVLIAVCLAASPMAAAALGGFSAGLYAGIVAALFHLTVFGARRHGVWVPWCALLLALVRPDGVIVGAGFVGVALVRAVRGGNGRPLLRHLLLAAAAGAAYYVWRTLYFGLPLPLPLYVKSKSDVSWPGLVSNVEWARGLRALGLLALLAVLMQRPVRGVRLAAGYLPGIALVAALTLAQQTQNVAFRFQLPCTTAVYVGAFIALGWVFRRRTRLARTVAIGVLFPALLFSAPPALTAAVRDLRSADYMNFFPFLLRPLTTGDTRIALSEAGRMGYWLRGTKLDLVGLNSPAVATQGLTPQVIADADPDVILVHVAGTLSTPPERTSDVVTVAAEDLERMLVDRRNWADVADPVRRAPLVVFAHLLAHPAEYELLLVWYQDGYTHLHAVKRAGRVHVDDYVARLRESFDPGHRRSYLEMVREAAREPE